MLRDGSWLTRPRLRAYPIIVLLAFAGALFWFAFGAGAQPWSGADFVGFWVPANLAAEGRSAAIYDPAVLQQLQESVSGVRGYLPWPYPPIYLLLILPLGLLPYWYAFVIWEGAGLAVCCCRPARRCRCAMNRPRGATPVVDQKEKRPPN